MKKKFCSFEDARKFVHSLGIKSQREWLAYTKSGNKPRNIPAHPNDVYKNEWKGLGDWLGTGRIADRLKQYRSFNDARKFVHSLGIKSQREWQRYSKSGKKPIDISSSPEKTYKNKGWNGYGDWLGTGNTSPRYRKYWPYEKARDYVHKLGLKYISDWHQFTKSGKLPKEIPADPFGVYKNNGWKSNGDWLGTGSIATYYRKYKTFEDARTFVQSLNLKKRDEWVDYYKSRKLPKDIPADPPHIYKNKGWKGWGDFLGTGFIANILREYWTFEKSKACPFFFVDCHRIRWNIMRFFV